MIAEVDVEHSTAGTTALRSGIEFRPFGVMALRGGLNSGQLSAGTGFGWRRFSLDYVYMNNPIAAEHRVGVAVAFGRDVEENRAAAQRREDQRLQARLDESFQQRLTNQIADLLRRAEQSRAAGHFDEAVEALGSARTLAPDDPRIGRLERASLLDKAAALEHSGDFPGAVVTYELVLAAAPSDSVATVGALRARAASDQRATRSIELRAGFERGLDHFTEGRLSAARQEFLALVTAAPSDSEAMGMLRRTDLAIVRSVVQLSDRADNALKAGRIDEALKLLDRIAELDPQAPGLAARRSELMKARRLTQSSLPAPTPLFPIAATPREKPDREKLARLHRQGVEAQSAGRMGEAIQYWELVQSVSPGYRGVDELLKREYLTRGMEAFAAGRLDEAIANWERVLRINPSDARARGYLERAREQATNRRQILGVFD